MTIVPGNSWMENGTAAALRQLELIGRTDIPVFMGVREPLMGSRQPWLEAEERLWGRSEYLGAYGRPRPESYLALDREPAIGYPTSKPSAEHAVDFIVRAVKAHPNEVTLFVLGPATNIALAIRKNPEIVPLVKRVYYMGGAIDVPGQHHAGRGVQLVVRSRVGAHHAAGAVPRADRRADRHRRAGLLHQGRVRPHRRRRRRRRSRSCSGKLHGPRFEQRRRRRGRSCGTR